MPKAVAEEAIIVSTPDSNVSKSFEVQWQGRFESLLSWQDFDDFWQVLQDENAEDWYITAVGQTLPETTQSIEDTRAFLLEMSALLHKEHDEDYCGIVYVDNKKAPALIKIYDPSNLGVSCGYSDNPPPPGWVMSKTKPEMISAFSDVVLVTGKRKRWWQKLIGK